MFDTFTKKCTRNYTGAYTNTPESITFRKFLTKNNARNLNVYENIGVPPPTPG